MTWSSLKTLVALIFLAVPDHMDQFIPSPTKKWPRSDLGTVFQSTAGHHRSRRKGRCFYGDTKYERTHSFVGAYVF